MCIFSSAVSSVSDTQIFVCPLANGQQFTVYKNKVILNGNQPTAMILPFPMPETWPQPSAPAATMFDMSKYRRDFFEDLQKLFPINDLRSIEVVVLSANSTYSLGPLPVHKCGDYEYSVANSLSDLPRLQSDVFRLSGNLVALLGAQYSRRFGFLICICRSSGAYAPVAFTHPMVDGNLFVPTMHDHHDQGATQLAYWDHTICTLGNVESHRSLDIQTSLGHSLKFNGCKYAADDFVDLSDHLHLSALPVGFPASTEKVYLRQYKIQGLQQNGDLSFHSTVWMGAATARGCTAMATGTNHYIQPWYECYTCGMTEGKGICVQCRKTCHRSHQVERKPAGPFYCDCEQEHHTTQS